MPRDAQAARLMGLAHQSGLHCVSALGLQGQPGSPRGSSPLLRASPLSAPLFPDAPGPRRGSLGSALLSRGPGSPGKLPGRTGPCAEAGVALSLQVPITVTGHKDTGSRASWPPGAQSTKRGNTPTRPSSIQVTPDIQRGGEFPPRRPQPAGELMASQAQPSGPPSTSHHPPVLVGRGRACPPSEAQMCTRSGRAGMEACSGSVDGPADKSWSLHLGALSEHGRDWRKPLPQGVNPGVSSRRHGASGHSEAGK